MLDILQQKVKKQGQYLSCFVQMFFVEERPFSITKHYNIEI